MTDVLTQVEQLRESREVDLEALAQNIANGEEIEATELDNILSSQSVELNDFSAQVNRYKRRNQLRGDIAKAADVEQQEQELRDQIAAEQAKLEDFVAKHRAAMVPLQQTLQELSHGKPDVNAARSELLRDCPSRDLRYQHAETLRQISAMAKMIESLRKKHLAAKQGVHQMAEDVRLSLLPETNAQRHQVQGAASRVEELEAELHEARSRYCELEAQLPDIEKKMTEY